MNRKILISGLSILASLAIVGGATWAYFSDEGASNDNVFAAGTLDLILSDDTVESGDDVTASFSGTNMAPGDCIESQQLRLKNTGTVVGDHIDITASNTDTDFASYLRINVLTYDLTDVTSQISDGNLNEITDLADWALDSDGLVNLTLTDLNNDHELDMVICLDESAENDQQAASNNTTFTVTLRQQTHGSETL